MDIKNISRCGIGFSGALLLYIGMGFGVSDAEARVLRCDNCSAAARQGVARGAGAGTHLVADYVLDSVSGYEVEYDRERRVWLALPASVPQQIRNSFAYSLSPQMANSGAVIIVGPNRPGNAFPFPGGFTGSNAHEIVRNASQRGILENQIASNYSGATTGSTVWNDTAFALSSMTLSVLGTPATIVIVWSDGSKTTLKIAPGATNRAQYQQGQSQDSEGHLIPDAAATNSGTGGNYAGHYGFNDPNTLQDWINTAVMYGVPVTGGGGGRTQMTCTWDGVTLHCHTY